MTVRHTVLAALAIVTVCAFPSLASAQDVPTIEEVVAETPSDSTSTAADDPVGDPAPPVSDEAPVADPLPATEEPAPPPEEPPPPPPAEEPAPVEPPPVDEAPIEPIVPEAPADSVRESDGPSPDAAVTKAPRVMTALQVYKQVAELTMAQQALAADLGDDGTPSSRNHRSSAVPPTPPPAPAPRPQTPPLAFFGGVSGGSAGGISFAFLALFSALLLLARPVLGGVIVLRLASPHSPLLVTRLRRPG